MQEDQESVKNATRREALLVGVMIVLGSITGYLFSSIEWENKYNALVSRYKEMNTTFNMYYAGKYMDQYNGNVINGLAFCQQGFLLVKAEGKEYWQALETFNHEWQHCKWGEDHYRS